MHSNKLQIGVCQIPNSIEIEKNFANILDLLKRFEESGVDLILFPECALSGFSSKMKECTPPILEPYLQKIQTWVDIAEVEVILPTAIVQNEKIYNSGFWFKKNHRTQFFKIGLTESEQGFFSVPTGATQKIFEIKNFNLALIICHEAEHDPWKYFGQGEADAILWPGYWGWKLKDKWEDSSVYPNMNHWKIPLIQSNFSYNDLGEYLSSGPEGLSRVISEDNSLEFHGAHQKVGGFIVELVKSQFNKTLISSCRGFFS